VLAPPGGDGAACGSVLGKLIVAQSRSNLCTTDERGSERALVELLKFLTMSGKFFIAVTILGLVGALAGCMALNLVLGMPFCWIWNAALSPLVQWPEIGYWQSVGLLTLATLLKTAIQGVEIKFSAKL